MTKLVNCTIVSHMEGGQRDDSYRWGTWRVCKDTEKVLAQYTRSVKAALKARKIKWFTIYHEIIDSDTGEVTVEVLAKGANEEIPTREFNTVAKGFVPPIKDKKKVMKSSFLIPPQFQPPPIEVVQGEQG